MDQQTLLVRRGVGAGALLVVLILLVVGIKGCVNSRKEHALKDYNRTVASLVHDSDTADGRALFQILGASDANSALELQTQVNQLRGVADDILKRARRADVPDETKVAHRDLLLTLELRRDALERIATRIPTAFGEQGAQSAIDGIAGQMQAFLASDVVFSQQVAPNIAKALNDADIGGQVIPESHFMPQLSGAPDLRWLNPDFVASALGTAVKGAAPRGRPAPGLHGHGLTAVSVGGVTLQPGAANRIPARTGLSFTVRFQNQGENDESGVTVRVRIEGAGRPIQIQKTGVSTTAGQEQTVSIPLDSAPPIGTPVTIKVTVAAVPGEKKKDNNSESYPAIFTRG